MSNYDSNKIENTKYLFLTAMLRAKETRMLTAEKAERMLTEPSFDDACRVAADCGYPDMSGMGIRQIEDTLSRHRREELEDIANIVPDQELLDLFRLKFDYHSAKAMVKSEGSAKHLLSYEGRVEAAEFLRSYMRKELGALPLSLAEAIHDARSMLSRTGNPCLADLILDRAYFREMLETAERTGLDFAVNYVKLVIDCTNLRALIRGKLAGKRPEIIDELLFDGGSILKESIIETAESGDGIVQLFAGAGLGRAAELGVKILSGGSMTDFELAADNAVNDYLSDAERIGFGPAVVISYMAAVENEIQSMRIILTGRQMGIDRSSFGEGCVRSMYKIAVIGSPDSVIGFKALGLDTYPVENSESARKTLHEIARGGTEGDEYAIIYIEETMAAEILSDISRYHDRPTPAIILIPGREGPIGLGQSALKEAVEKAVGSDIL